MSRISFEFSGTKSTPLSLDPREYKNLSVEKIASIIAAHLHAEDPSVDYWGPDIEMAAITLKDNSGS